MAEELIISTGDKEQRYQELLPQVQGLLSGEDDMIANMAKYGCGTANDV